MLGDGTGVVKEQDQLHVKYPASCSCVLRLSVPELTTLHGALELPNRLFGCPCNGGDMEMGEI
jgi:hypothetical protein